MLNPQKEPSVPAIPYYMQVFEDPALSFWVCDTEGQILHHQGEVNAPCKRMERVSPNMAPLKNCFYKALTLGTATTRFVYQDKSYHVQSRFSKESGLISMLFMDMGRDLPVEDDLALENQHLKELLEEWKTFGTIISHDLNEPLRTIRTYLYLFEKECGNDFNDTGSTYFQFAKKASIMMQNQLKGLLELNRIGRKSPQIETLNVSVCIKKALAYKQPDLDRKNVTVTLCSKDCIVYGVNSYISKMMLHLIENSFLYNTHPRPKLDISCTEIEGNALISVKDNGPGIDPMFHGKIFEVFSRIGKRPDEDHLGLGLAYCKKAAQYLNGRIWVDSEIGKGSTFYVSFPLVALRETQCVA